MAQWKRAGPITQRSVDRNYALLTSYFYYFFYLGLAVLMDNGIHLAYVPLAQWIARWTSNPKVLGSTPRWDEQCLVLWCSGYHICFTRRRSPVRSWAGSNLFSKEALNNKDEIKEEKKKKIIPSGDRTQDLWIRSPTRYPLR